MVSCEHSILCSYQWLTCYCFYILVRFVSTCFYGSKDCVIVFPRLCSPFQDKLENVNVWYLLMWSFSWAWDPSCEYKSFSCSLDHSGPLNIQWAPNKVVWATSSCEHYIHTICAHNIYVMSKRWLLIFPTCPKSALYGIIDFTLKIWSIFLGKLIF